MAKIKNTGHGGYVRDDDWGEEADGYDETLVPVDYATAGQIRDDDLYSSLVCALPEGVTMVSVMDCCHSATVLDLPYQYKATANGVTGTTSGSSSAMAGNTNTTMSQCLGGKMSLPRLLGILALIFALFTIAVAIQHFISRSE